MGKLRRRCAKVLMIATMVTEMSLYVRAVVKGSVGALQAKGDGKEKINCFYAGPNCADCVALEHCGWCLDGNEAPSCVETKTVTDAVFGERLIPSHPGDTCRRWVVSDTGGAFAAGDRCDGDGEPIHRLVAAEPIPNATLPTNDAECEFDYWKFKCEYPEVCEYRYQFGDITFDQSCRHKSTRKKHKTPTVDDECHWAYGGARCDDEDVCEYRYELGDLTLGQSCRMKDKDRPPKSDGECGWDASKASCDWPKYCEYRYELGDGTLGASCRLKKRVVPKTDDDCKWDYASAKCDFPQHCEYHFWVGDMTLDQSCVMRGSRDQEEDKKPTTDEECGWDYKSARCAWPEVCSYHYQFGDMELGHSCRLTANHQLTYDGDEPTRDGDCDWDYARGHCAWPSVCSFQFQAGDWSLDASCRMTVRGETDTPGKTGEEPHSDEDCKWEYAESRCAWPEKCMYKLCVGDMTLDQSCRLRSSWEKGNKTCSMSDQDKAPIDDAGCSWDYANGKCKWPEMCQYHYCAFDTSLDQSCRFAVKDRTCNDTQFAKYTDTPDFPENDADCSWDYDTAECTHPRFCRFTYCFGDVTLGQSCRLKRSDQRCASDNDRARRERNSMLRDRNQRLEEARVRRLRIEKRANEQKVAWERVQKMLRDQEDKKKLEDGMERYEKRLEAVGWREKARVLDRRPRFPDREKAGHEDDKAPLVDSVLRPLGVLPEQAQRQRSEKACDQQCLNYESGKDLWRGCIRDCLFPPKTSDEATKTGDSQ